MSATRIFLCALFLVSQLSCQRSPDFLYRDMPLHEEFEPHNVKDLLGNSRADIIWVIDNSGSMSDDHQNVIANTNTFMQQFTRKHVDWKMGLMSADISQQPFLGFSNPFLYSSPDPVKTFQTAVQQMSSQGGSGTEKSFEPLETWLTANPAFLRSSALLAIIMVTDENEQSSMPVADFIQFLLTLKSSEKDILPLGVIGATDLQCPSAGWNYTGGRYEQFITTLGGQVYSLCDPNFGDTLAKIAMNIAERVANPRAILSSRPEIGSISVTHNEKVLPGGPKDQGGYWVYDYELNALVFHDLNFAPGDKEMVIIRYKKAAIQ